MRKFFRTIIAGAALCSMFVAPSFASNFNDCADRLHEIGLFIGTGSGYELDRSPTRAEAAVMLVRLLGQEAEAMKLTYTAPFADLQGWEKPYVQYLYDNGLTTGTATSTFSPTLKCTSQMYAAFLLRTLGYTDANFNYADSVPYAEKIGLYSYETVDNSNFLRDHMVAASYTALSLVPNGKNSILLDELVNENAVSKEKSQRLHEILNTYNEYLDAVKGMDELSAVSLNHEFTVNTDTLSINSTETIDLDLEAPARSSKRQYTLSAPGMADKTITDNIYIANHKYRLVRNGMISTRELSDTEFENLTSGYSVAPVALISDITLSGSTYTVSFNNAGIKSLNGAMDALASATGNLDELGISGISVQHTLKDGLISSQEIHMNLNSNALSGNVYSKMTLEKVNNDVTVVSPGPL